MKFLIIFVYILLNSFPNKLIVFGALDLENVGLNSNFFINDIVVYLNRAFLAIPRTICQNNVTSPTLVEVPWKEYNTILKIRHNKAIENQLWAKCDNLQNAVSLAKEKIKSKLWILDQGNDYCPPKILVYSLFHNVFFNQSIILNYVPRKELNNIIIENSTTIGSHRAYISNIGSNSILVCTLDSFTCQTVKVLDAGYPIKSLMIQSIAISKTTSNLYFINKQSDEVYFIDLNYFSNEDLGDNLLKEGMISVNATLLGQTLGPSSGLETDLKKGLIYYLTRDYAIVRWIIGKPMNAENHDVLAQSYKRMPYVSRIFTDPQNGIWALVNPFSPESCQSDLTKLYELERAAKIMRYNRLLDIFL